MNNRLTKDDENTLHFKGRDRVGMGLSIEHHEPGITKGNENPPFSKGESRFPPLEKGG